MKRSITTISLMVMALFSCGQDTIDSKAEIDDGSSYNSTSIRYLALGDSYTIGESVPESDRYPIQLSNRLINDSIKIDTTIIIAKTGWRTDDLISAIDNANVEGVFDMVSLLIGVNNQYQGKPITQYESEFAELLDTAIKYADGDKSKVFVISIPDYGYTPFGKSNQSIISAELDEYNAINKSIAQNKGITWFNITPISKNGLVDPELVAPDGLHPSGKMYSQWVDLFYKQVKNSLE